MAELVPEHVLDPNAHPVCLKELRTFDPAPVTEVAAVMSAVKHACETETSCGNLQLKKVLEAAINQRGPAHRGWFKRMMFYPRRILVPAIYITSVVGPGLLTLYIASKFGLPMDYKVVVSSSVGAASGFLLGRFGSTLERMLGPHLEQLAMTIWDPNDKDSWGRIQKTLNEKDRLINSQIYNQLLVFGSHFKVAGAAIRDAVELKVTPDAEVSLIQAAEVEANPSREIDPMMALALLRASAFNNTPERDRAVEAAVAADQQIKDNIIKRDKKMALAADQYALALMHSFNLFGGLHYYHPNTVSAMRSHLPRKGEFRDEIDLSIQDKVELIIRVCRTIQLRKEDEIPEGVNREDLMRFAFGVMLRWLVVHDHPEAQIRATNAISTTASTATPEAQLLPATTAK